MNLIYLLSMFIKKTIGTKQSVLNTSEDLPTTKQSENITAFSDDQLVQKINEKGKTQDEKIELERKACSELIENEKKIFEQELIDERKEHKKNIKSEWEEFEMVRKALESCDKNNKEEYSELRAFFALALNKWHYFYREEVKRSKEKEILLKKMLEAKVSNIMKESDNRIRNIRNQETE
ncbi:uncharacterized protein VNE69_09055 [Vairimorpha necatrix]|uniref:Uncharacterized protein n=1 Tax=Vairimorpha necatrix TaxID=6039 RepID=A0AAX4JEQ8_9MICR